MSWVDESVSEPRYFVDEAGDSTLFDSTGRAIIGTEGCSRFFILGVLRVEDPARLRREIATLRAGLLADPWFRRVPSMQPQYGKTARAFHAKDDCPEVRREVFRLLSRHALRFLAVVKDKAVLLDAVRARNKCNPAWRHDPNETYDSLVRYAFRGLLHEQGVCHVCFSRRGKSDRTKALRAALEETLGREKADPKGACVTQVHVQALWNQDDAGLQAADYFLWSVQRLYERGEDRFVELLWPQLERVHDLDDPRGGEEGVVYTQQRPLSLATLTGRPGI